MSDFPIREPVTGPNAFHRALEIAKARQDEANADADALRARQLASGTLPAPTPNVPCAWQRAIDAGAIEAAAQAEEEREREADYYKRARRAAGVADA